MKRALTSHNACRCVVKGQVGEAHANEKETTPATTTHYTRCAKVKEERLSGSAPARSMSEDDEQESERTGLC